MQVKCNSRFFPPCFYMWDRHIKNFNLRITFLEDQQGKVSLNSEHFSNFHILPTFLYKKKLSKQSQKQTETTL
jgi:hypothetical protein